MKIGIFQEKAQSTDKIPWNDPYGSDIPLLGIIGEVGSVSTVLKKWQRDPLANGAFDEQVNEELGDVLWYVVITAFRLGVIINYEPKTSERINVIEAFYRLVKNVSKLLNEQNNLIILHNSPTKEVEKLVYSILTDIHVNTSLNPQSQCAQIMIIFLDVEIFFHFLISLLRILAHRR